MANVGKFLRAAAEGNLPRVQKMLRDGDARITDADEHGNTAFRGENGISLIPDTEMAIEKGRRSNHRKGPTRQHCPSIGCY
jgi:hypothetical protein